MDRNYYSDEYEVSPLFKSGRFVCDTCKGTLGLTQEHVERLINNGPLTCIRCNTALDVEGQTRADLKATFNRMVVRHLLRVFLGGFLIPLFVGLHFFYGADFFGFLMLLFGSCLYLFIRMCEKNEPEVYVSLKKLKQPEMKRRYRRMWRLEYK